MIIQDIYSFLKQDLTLSTTLNATTQDSKIYPNFARLSSRIPYIVYQVTNAGGSQDEVLSEEDITFLITAEDYSKVVVISYLLTSLFDLTCNTIPSTTYNIYYSKKVGGTDYTDDLGRYVRALNFIFKFSKK